ncbi:cysteine-rich motor neuron 1 protein-like isoform X2 [Anneissia japonica]|uniref:cysteine-rich motor neuron 1 protein-like isoform X2 n=1 Tax=Anneissia japonica TaxID=1529436 RepID=UPI001425859F|nr:cysteine-rich motor neuron 1 protein-like isoform X2 [Anneissia japonica]
MDVYIIFTVFMLKWITRVDCGIIQHRDIRALSEMICPPCEEVHCSPRKASKLKCPGGVTTGVCGCCPECAKQEGEKCGSRWDYLGKCDAGLECVESNEDTTANNEPFPAGGGICKRNPMRDEAVSGCQPKCTPDFCKENPKAICSAINNADVKMDCQGECQHTSCMACEFVSTEPECGRCGKNDFRCMRQYAKCLKKHVCEKRFPCGLGSEEGHDFENGKFQCRVPFCVGN